VLAGYLGAQLVRGKLGSRAWIRRSGMCGSDACTFPELGQILHTFVNKKKGHWFYILLLQGAKGKMLRSRRAAWGSAGKLRCPGSPAAAVTEGPAEHSFTPWVYWIQ